MNTSEKGDDLEASFYEYLVEQKNNGELLYGLYSPENCTIFRKKGIFVRSEGQTFNLILS